MLDVLLGVCVKCGQDSAAACFHACYVHKLLGHGYPKAKCLSPTNPRAPLASAHVYHLLCGCLSSDPQLFTICDLVRYDLSAISCCPAVYHSVAHPDALHLRLVWRLRRTGWGMLKDQA